MIFCWLNQKYLGWLLDGGGTVPASRQRHLQECPTCRRYYQEQAQLTQRLAGEADQVRAVPSPFLRHRILAAIDRCEENGQAVAAWRLAWASPLAAAGLALAFALVFWPQSGTEQVPVQATAPGPAVALELPVIPPQLKQLDEANLWAWSKVLQQPLEQEIQGVLNDAKTAVQVLAQNFLPDQR